MSLHPRALLILCAATFGLSACSVEAPPPPAPTAEHPAGAPTVIDGQLRALEKAKGVEADVLEQSQRTLERADQADPTDPPN